MRPAGLWDFPQSACVDRRKTTPGSMQRTWTMTTRRESVPSSRDCTYERPIGVGLGVVGAAWVVTLTFLILMLFA
jgi:hypothetical protein